VSRGAAPVRADTAKTGAGNIVAPRPGAKRDCALLARELGISEGTDRPRLDQVLALFAAMHRREMETPLPTAEARALYNDL
jgi:hypothetical protein